MDSKQDLSSVWVKLLRITKLITDAFYNNKLYHKVYAMIFLLKTHENARVRDFAAEAI